MAIGAKTSRVANRYAKAIFSLFEKDQRGLGAVLVELRSFHALMQESETVRSALTNPAFPAVKRSQLVDDFVARLKLGAPARQILMVVAEGDRLVCLGEIVGGVEGLRLKAANLVPLAVETPSALSAEEQKRVVSRFGVILGHPVEPSFVVNPGLIGGIRVVANGKTYDGSVFGWLNSFQERSAGGA
ncbi:MAG: ATP synthase F1 subunit delta [Deltaproteobacteria bacterium]|nr:ATP synthase F1 subunit delta [Deltaproteobacteria bacterium]MBI3293750.1 ATP synthase F1 subunit delta [Deltaproteobacteria bacterium]